MSGLLPHVVQHADSARSVLSASQSFGVVTLVLLVVLLIEREALRMAGAHPARVKALTVACVPLLVAVALTLVARVALIIQ
jgi:hypothetical protein